MVKNAWRLSSVEKYNRARLPRSGAIILSINKTSTTSLGYKRTRQLIRQFESCSKKIHECGSSKEGNPTTLNSLPSNVSSSKDASHYTVTIFEANACDWGCVDTVDISVSGFKLTLIDDSNGRDMPLLRVGITDSRIHIKRGLNLKVSYTCIYE